MNTNNSNMPIAKAIDYIGKKISIKIDRALHSKHPKYGWEYQLNYGFVPGTLSPDGEELDAYLMGVNESVETYNGICIAAIHRKDDDDDKLIIVPEGHPGFTDSEILKATHFQEQWFSPTVIRG